MGFIIHTKKEDIDLHFEVEDLARDKYDEDFL